MLDPQRLKHAHLEQAPHVQLSKHAWKLLTETPRFQVPDFKSSAQALNLKP